jgi:hypothetical protein
MRWIFLAVLACGDGVTDIPPLRINSPCCECLARTKIGGVPCTDTSVDECRSAETIRTGCVCLNECADECGGGCEE